MMEISSLKNPSVNLQETARSPERARQGTASVVNGESQSKTAPAPMELQQAEKLADKLNQTLKKADSNLSVSVDDATGVIVARVTDNETGEIVKQIPPQQILDANVSVEKIIGLLVNDQA